MKGKKYQEEDPPNYCHQPSTPCISPNMLPRGCMKRKGLVKEWRWGQKNPVSQLLRGGGVGVTTHWSFLP